MEHIENKGLWNALVVVTIMVGGIAAILSSGKEKFLPHLYASEHIELYGDSVTTDSTHAEPAATDRPAEMEPEKKTNEYAVTFSPGEYVLVAGSFLTQGYATAFQKNMVEKMEDIAPEVVAISNNDSTYYRVVVMRSAQWAEIKALKNKLNDAGYAEVWAFRQQ